MKSPDDIGSLQSLLREVLAELAAFINRQKILHGSIIFFFSY
ncbi:hypothetical protein [Thermoflexibacter ruber]|nr:hypothetical protein [Thermoflexibacter ruber]